MVVAATGLTQRGAWLIRSDEPLYLERSSPWAELKTVEGNMAKAFMETDTTMNAVRAVMAMTREWGRRRGNLFWEEYRFLAFGGSGDVGMSVIVFPRDPADQARSGLVVINRNESETRPTEELAGTMERLQGRPDGRR